jgi:PST family polysaccharide transporter
MGPPDAAPPAGTLAGRTIGAGQWRVASALLQGALQFGLGIVLARLLPPEDFGLASLALIVVGFATLLADLGLGASVVQRQPLTERHIRVAFTASSLTGVAVMLILWILAPLGAPLLRNAELPRVLRAESLLFLFAGAASTARGLLQRRLDFRRLLLVDVVSYAVGYAIVASVLAWAGFGVWSLVAGTVLQAAVAASLAIALARQPLRPLLAREELRDLTGFGAGVALNTLVNQVAFYGDNLVVGRVLGTRALGLYGRAFSLMALPLGYVGNAIFAVLFPALSEIRGDMARLTRGYLAGLELTTMFAAPVMIGMVVAAPHLVVGLYGPRWAGAAAPLQILCAAGLFRAAYLPAGAVTHATGSVYAEMRRQVVYAILVLAGSIVGSRWGIAGVATGVAVAIVYKYAAVLQLTSRITGCGWRKLLGAQLPGLLLGVEVGAAALAARWLAERQGAASLVAFAAIAAASAIALALGTRLLPRRVRPAALDTTIVALAARLPLALSRPVARVLRVFA